MTSTVFHIREHVLPCQHIREYARATAFTQEEELHLAIKQYVPVDNPNPQPGDVTIIGAHANGFPKELYEPLWMDLHAQAKTQGFRIRGIWIADVAQQGASGVLNEHLLGNDPSWFDHPRDLLLMVNSFRAQMPLPIVGIGHSMGACHLVNLALMHPRLLSTLILIEPVIQAHPADDPVSKDTGHLPARASTFRRDIWPTRAAAAASFRKQPYYQAWDPRVLTLWLEHGIRPTPTALYPDEASSAVTLTTTRHQEVWTFLRPRFDPANTTKDDDYPDIDPSHPATFPFYLAAIPLTFDRLPQLRPSTLYIFGAASPMSTPALQAAKLHTTGTGTGGSGGLQHGRVQALSFPNASHLVPLEAVAQTAAAAAAWLAPELQRWSHQHDAYRHWAQAPLRERLELTEEWKTRIGGPPRPPGPEKAKI